ncbi:MAG: cytochrome c nitrite reductase small subunit [Bacteroidales bacterium]|nr:cytochrome c nitrite reductase small subunit [Bacteroidales bacterium]
MKKFLSYFPSWLILPMFIIGGVIVGLSAYSMYMSRLHSYLSDDPEACINCHIMDSYYDAWSHSSHREFANCNDCHVPHNNVFNKYYFKAADGLFHSAVFTFHAEPQVIRPRNASNNVIMNNCIRCHEQLNTALVKTGMYSYNEAKEGKAKVCWECHQNVPHTKISNISSSPNSLAPLPKSPVPNWLKNKMK